MKKEIYALGIGHNTPVFIDLAEACGYKVKGLYHYNKDKTGQSDHGFKIIGSFDDLFSKDNLKGLNFLLTMGDNKIRASISEKIIKLEGQIPTLIHPTAIVSRFSNISDIGVYISPFSYIQADSIIGSNTIILSGVNISHTNKIGNCCFIAGGATIGAYTTIEDFVFVGQGALSISGKVPKIGQHSYIGARSLLTHEIPPFSVVAGSPAKIIKTITDE
ncbi:MAG: transferase [Coprobacter fastidiosus]|nr:MAG: transferase [Coprobacter fastidiosus]